MNKNTTHIYLSYLIDEKTPTYGNRNVINLTRKSDMSKGDVANETHLQSTLHIGTHIDFPFHFYKNGKTLKDYPAAFWVFRNPLFLEIKPRSLVIEKELLEKLENISQKKNTDILIVKTGSCDFRNEQKYWESNVGFSPSIYDYLQEEMPAVRIFGFDSISVSSFQHRDIGRLAHKKFLNPEKPILLMEDMDLRSINDALRPDELIIAPLMISNADGVPCTVIANVNQYPGDIDE